MLRGINIVSYAFSCRRNEQWRTFDDSKGAFCERDVVDDLEYR